MGEKIKQQLIVTGKSVVIPLGIVVAIIVFIIAPIKNYVDFQATIKENVARSNENRARIERLETSQATFQLQLLQDISVIKYQINQLLDEKK